LHYFRDGAEIRPMVADDHGVIWLSALRSTKDASGEERLFATYRKVADGLRTVEQGLAEYDDAAGVFRVAEPYPSDAAITPEGHAFRYGVDGVTYLQYDWDVRSRDDAASVRDRTSYQAFTPLRAGARRPEAVALERDAQGRLVWGWKRDTAPISHAKWDELVRSGAVEERERPYQLIDVETGETIVPQNGSIHWNAFRRRWVMIRSQFGGASALGEIYYFEGDSPLGPWAYGRKVVTHAREEIGPDGQVARKTYSFYNPMQHPEFDRAEGREIFFEATFTTLFASPAAPPIPSYDYNQIMYKLSLEDRRLALPVAVYRLPGDPPSYRTRDALLEGKPADLPAPLPGEIAFFAPDRPRKGTVPVREVGSEPGSAPRMVARNSAGGGPVLFYCASPKRRPPPASVPLYERQDEHGLFTYTTAAPSEPAPILCHVWPAPVDFETSTPRF
jgi:hypothetical protein